MSGPPPTLAFDVYGTLVDTAGVAAALGPLAGARAALFAAGWRTRQLEYAFRRALMRDYRDFAVCVAQAFDATCLEFALRPGPGERERLLDAYRRLPAFADAGPALGRLRAAGLRLLAFSNARVEDLDSLLEHAGLREHFERAVSLEPVRTFKPDPAAYAYFTREAGSRPAETWLISGNPFDVIGAMGCGWKAAWLRRSPLAMFDPWGVSPTAEFAHLGELADRFVQTAGER